MKRRNPLSPGTPATPLPQYSPSPWTLVQCQKTGLVYLENPPAYEELEETFAWEKTYVTEKQRRRQAEPLWSKLSDASKKARRLLKRPRKIATLPLAFLDAQSAKPISFIDIGAGDAVHTTHVADYISGKLGRAVRPIAIEISKAQAAEATLRLATYQGGYCVQASALDGTRQLAGKEKADLILLSSFLEHEVQPVELLSACARLLAPDGIVVIKVPNFACWNRRLRGPKWCGFRYPDHVNYFTPSTLRLAIEKSGLALARQNLRDRFPLSDNMYAVARKRAGTE